MTKNKLKQIIKKMVTESLNESSSSKSDINRRFQNIIKELDSRGIDYELIEDDEINQVYDDTCLKLIRIDGTDSFGLFKDGGYYSICIGDELKEVPKGKTAKDIVDLVVNIKNESLNEDRHSPIYNKAFKYLKDHHSLLSADDIRDTIETICWDLFNKDTDDVSYSTYDSIEKAVNDYAQSLEYNSTDEEKESVEKIESYIKRLDPNAVIKKEKTESNTYGASMPTFMNITFNYNGKKCERIYLYVEESGMIEDTEGDFICNDYDEFEEYFLDWVDQIC